MNYFYLLILIPLLLSCNDENSPNPITPIVAAPDFANDPQGCASFFIYDYTSNNLGGISVHGNRDEMGLTLEEQTLYLEGVPDLSVKYVEFDGPASSVYCDDVAGDDPSVVETWNATSATLKIQIVEDSVFVNEWTMEYRMTLKMYDLELQNQSNEKMEIDSLIFENIYVGWLPG